MAKISIETLKSKDMLAGYCATLVAVIIGYALSQGINGTVLAVGVGLISGLGGYFGKKKQIQP